MKKNNLFFYIFPLHSVNKKLCSLESLKPPKDLGEGMIFHKLNAMENFIGGMSFQEVISKLCGENLSPQDFMNMPPFMFYTYIKERLNIAEHRKKELDALRSKK